MTRRPILFAFAVTSALLACCAAVATPTTPRIVFPPGPVHPTPGEYRLSVVPDRTTVEAAEPILLEIRLFKDGGPPVTMVSFREMEAMEYTFRVTTENGKPAGLTRYGRFALLPRRGPVLADPLLFVMHKGKYVRYRVALNQLFDMTTPGRYVVRVTKDLALRRSESIPVISKPVVIEVVQDATTSEELRNAPVRDK